MFSKSAGYKIIILKIYFISMYQAETENQNFKEVIIQGTTKYMYRNKSNKRCLRQFWRKL